ncbi:hypothetical protein BJ138DRAFT_1120615 [Hygrophoropsis aurantiaca]|uniref:Uncharacterized protein n=1 Tax=Hygrophoropsis aurantiaca TaxID=72124 RepID=A0ACB7ZR18_9AGAM|nr:hypothetical protein BJ138DRAFT_1120615 [Hygrophoropsis aurantiaca]
MPTPTCSNTKCVRLVSTTELRPSGQPFRYCRRCRRKTREAARRHRENLINRFQQVGEEADGDYEEDEDEEDPQGHYEEARYPFDDLIRDVDGAIAEIDRQIAVLQKRRRECVKEREYLVEEDAAM